MVTIAKGGKPKIYIHSQDLSAHAKVSNVTLAAQTVDATTFADSGVKRKVGLKDHSFRLECLFDSTALKSHAALKDLLATQRIVSVYPDGDVAASEGIVLNEAHAEQYELPASVGELVPANASIVQSGVDGLPAVSLATRHTANITATEQKAGVDNGASSSAGGTLTIHVYVFSASGGNAQWNANIQESSDNGGDAYVTIATIAISAVGASQVTWAGATEQYLRIEWELDATSGTLQAHAGAERN